MNELQAVFGLLQLKYFDTCLEKRKRITGLYREQLNDIGGISFLSDIPGIFHNYSYFPTLVDKNQFGICRDCLYEELKGITYLVEDIFAR